MFAIRVRLLTPLVCVFASVSACEADAGNNARLTPLVEAVQHCKASVVNIHTEKPGVEEKDSRFFNAKPRRVTGMGTGIVVDERGYIVTNFHVINEVEQITVTLEDGETFEARPVSFDRRHDLAIIHIKSDRPLSVMPMGTSSDLMLAETVFAVGNAFGYEHTVTAGIISALARDVEVDETQSYENLIQTDASINPGNSGGPLLNANGEVIGINVAIRAGAQRIGFAIPIDDARTTIARLLSTERLNGVSHGLVGTDVKSPEEKTLVVQKVIRGSAADKCGLRSGDVITRVREISICDRADWERSLLDIPLGKVVDVKVVRDARDITLQFTVGVGKPVPQSVAKSASVAAQSVSTAAAVPVVENEAERPLDKAWRLLGLRLTEIGDRDRQSLGRYNGGMKVTVVKSDSLSARHGIRSGDILLGLDGFETLGAENLKFILQDSRLSKMPALSFQIFRGGSGALMGEINLAGSGQ